jgi:hypothetical protein
MVPNEVDVNSIVPMLIKLEAVKQNGYKLKENFRAKAIEGISGKSTLVQEKVILDVFDACNESKDYDFKKVSLGNIVEHLKHLE